MVADIHLGVLGSENVGLAKAPGISVDLVGVEAEALKVLSGKGCELGGDDDRATGSAGCGQSQAVQSLVEAIGDKKRNPHESLEGV